jgi:hypothetical protein
MSNLAKKTRLQHLFCCRNSRCPKPVGFTTERGLRIHYGNSLHCGAHAGACQAYIKRNNIVQPHPSPNQPWDFGNDDATSVAHIANSRVLPTFNNDTVDVKMDVDEDNSSQNTYQFGIKYTTAQFTETKLLKILNDAAPTFFIS